MLGRRMSDSSVATTRTGRLRSFRFWLLALVAVHVVHGIARLPHAVLGKRLREIEGYRRDGDVEWLLANARLHGAEALRRVRTSCPEHEAVVLYGPLKGALEFAPALLWPRLCVAADRIPAGAVAHAGHRLHHLGLAGDRTTLRIVER
jgi:hypothetical protein